ncbi:endoglucanase 12-like [Gastrolobium bilobum]|uniref:endoglucanase 12-like n=1 Tax=Gastrolobium bilobum TaxID=150636 RepID=UPI002AB2DFA1|nr:endoglucanase 12-like [Gastrolobium bilobum]
MHSRNHWGGSFEMDTSGEVASGGYENSRNTCTEWDRAALLEHDSQSHQILRHDLDETLQSWVLERAENKKKTKYVDFGCIVFSHKALKWILGSIFVAFCVIGLPIIIAKSLPKHHSRPTPPDNYTLALHKALLFFNAQKSGRLPKNNGIPWRGNSGLQDGNDTDVKGGLVGGYYDAGDNIKFHFPMSFAMTMLSWSVLEYKQKYIAINEYAHARELIKWGTDYLLLTFNTSATKISKIYGQVGGSLNGTTTPDDHHCWQRPEDMDYPRPTIPIFQGPDLAGEMAAALAAASIVFQDDVVYSQKLIKGAETVFTFARDSGKRRQYSKGQAYIEPYYNSSGYYDEYMWGGAWLYYATGNRTYISLATNPGIPKNARAFSMIPDLSVLSWNNKLPAAMLLLTRFRVFLNPGYPYEDMLNMYQNITGLTMCSYLHQFNVFNWTKGGLIQLNHGQPQDLQYVANAAFLASLFADYMDVIDVPGWYCGSNFFQTSVLKAFATSQIDYIMGKNPMKMSYIVGFGNKYPKHVHHRGASTPNDHKHYSCTGGFKWRDSSNQNPNTITGALVGGPDRFDQFHDSRSNYNYTEPTLAGNAGLVAALISLTSTTGSGIDKNTIFSAIPPLGPQNPPPPPPWKP